MPPIIGDKGNPLAPSADRNESIADDEVDDRKASQATALEIYLKESLGFNVTVRTLNYIVRRLDEVGIAESPHKVLQKFFTEDRMLEFKTIFLETLNIVPFASVKERNIDLINALNYAIFDELQGKKVAQEGLRSVLRWRKERSECKEAGYA